MLEKQINNPSLTKPLSKREYAAYSLGFNYGFICGIVLGGVLGIIALLWRIYG